MSWKVSKKGWTHTTDCRSPFYGGAFVSGCMRGRKRFYSWASLNKAGIDKSMKPTSRWNGMVSAGEFVAEMLDPTKVLRKGRKVQ